MSKTVSFPDFRAINKRIDDMRKERNISQAELGEEIGGISQEDMSKKLHSKGSNFTTEQYIMIADYFDVSLDELFGRSSASKTSSKLFPRDVCEMLTEIYLSNYGFIISPESTTEDVWIEFRSNSIEYSLPSHDLSSYQNVETRSINEFILRLKQIDDIRKEDSLRKLGFDNEMFNTLLERYLAGVDDASMHDEGQRAFIEAMREHNTEPCPCSAEAKALAQIEHVFEIEPPETSAPK